MSDNREDLISSFKLDHEGNTEKENELLKTANKYLLSQNADADLLKSTFNKIVSVVGILISFLYIQFLMPRFSYEANVAILIVSIIFSIVFCFIIRNKLVKILRG